MTKWLLLVTGKRRGRFLSYRLVCGRSHYNGYYNRCSEEALKWDLNVSVSC